jgi:hypothetical protein
MFAQHVGSGEVQATAATAPRSTALPSIKRRVNKLSV